MKPPKAGLIDHQALAKSIIRARKLQGMTQAELAVRSKVSLPSIFRAERGQPLRLSTLRKVATGLNVTFDSLFLPQVEGSEIVIHRIATANWYAEYDHRTHLPEDHLVRYQDADERHRLGRLGFVPAFVAPPAGIMKNGPGVVYLELFSELHGSFNSQYYQDAVIFAVRGRAKLAIGTESFEISEGDWIGFPTGDLKMMGSADEPGTSQYPAVVLWVGANRFSKKAKKAGKV